MKRIAYVTGKRGGVDALMPLLHMIQKGCSLRVIPMDQHNDPIFGKTVEYLMLDLPDGQISPIYYNPLQHDNADSRLRNLAEIQVMLTKRFCQERPDLLILYGDRGESLQAAIVAHNMNIPILHIKGGDITGGVDNANRHAITMMSTYHLTASGEALARVNDMMRHCRQEYKAMCIGEAHLDPIILEERATSAAHDFCVTDPKMIVHLHPDTLSPDNNFKNCLAVGEIYLALGKPDTLAVYPCNDTGYQEIIDWLEHMVGAEGWDIYSTLKPAHYRRLMRSADVCVGNSSAFVLETPYLRTPSILVGDRQRGRYCHLGAAHISDVQDIQAFVGNPHLYPSLPTETSADKAYAFLQEEGYIE